MKRGDCHREPVSVAGAGAVLVGLALACTWPGPVAAADANELIKEAVALRRKGDDLGALERLQQAFQIDKGARVVGQIGLAEQALGRWVPAHDHLSQALEVKTDPWIVKNRAAIRDALNQVNDHVGAIEILGGSPRAEVRIDGTLRGTLPLAGPLTMSTGMVTIDLSAPGLVPVQRTTTVRARQTVRESFDALAPVPNREKVTAKAEPIVAAPSPVADTAPTPAIDPAEARTPPSTPQPEPAANHRPSSLRSSAKWIAWGLGGAAVGVGIFGLVRQNSAADSFDKGCGVDPNGTIQPLQGSTTTAAACRDFKSRIDSNFRLEMIGFVSAAVFAGAGLVLWLTEPEPNQANAMALACLPGVVSENRLWMGCRLQF